MTGDKLSNQMWGGRFAAGPAAIMEEINASIDFDQKLYRQDIEGSLSHAAMLAQTKIISHSDYEKIVHGLQLIRQEIETGSFTFSRKLEDIHMNIEARLSELIGPVAGRLHTARSRNDQVAVDFRLWVREAAQKIAQALKDLMEQLLMRAEQHADTLMPGFTHLQTAQPVTFGHYMMAYVEMFGRDLSRMRDAIERMNESPLGAAALAGTGFPIDRFMTAQALGFREPTRNSIDSVSDRDFALEFLSAGALCAMHLSRLAEEIILWSSAQFHFIRLSDAFSTGSSIMPQKRNPDAAELVRAKAGRLNAALMGLLTVMKGLPLAYSKDMQEDKEYVFDGVLNLELSLAAMMGIISDLEVNKEAMKQAAGSGYAIATDLADWCVRELGLPFREAHHITGRAVALAEQKKCSLDELSLDEFQTLHPDINAAVFDVLTIEKSVESRNSFGGTAPSEVLRQVAYWKQHLVTA
ncbi:argininosuccinate lyase [Bartonella bacilliformis Peru38]|uniref:Argininosuccinate lyase n=2 Tax=Bartonella bacilliformis TaxID=774 RepID=ARLY_BARBK|nr:argininosuccinate lyase [Bartonella bacilliformis]A1UQY9.1 RecName: Full=Argininosuccinate lyase; Short=ASAL; AltName: Full=Arginosuccinase [Bartonella bacilliformis KC583]ABM45432.1 argininosuccinate lyase [Bartonella bacilliformis KC583]AMG85288.1 argininosuccinate lyase [Bartonella bacilliformis]EKS45950.1 argininosuccinate lyase [Bartonella bacilliformis INS]EYS88811.1 argininosuccinate lyase [Bartonella bacilliformis San Pedro600-02]EYS95514.1 argininosuccinate lyase [Bartonella bacil